MSKRFKDELPTLTQPYNEDKLRLTDHHTLKLPLPLLTTRWTSTSNALKCNSSHFAVSKEDESDQIKADDKTVLSM